MSERDTSLGPRDGGADVPPSSLSVAEVRALLASAPLERLPALIASFSQDPRAGALSAVVAARRRVAREERETGRLEALLRTERELRAAGARAVAGIDEVGRGALAGPVTAAAVVLGDALPPAGLDDSKRLAPARRETLAEEIRRVCVAIAVVHVGAERIDRVGIVAATREAMADALRSLRVGVDHVLVDGLPVGLHARETAMPRADSACACVAAASIVAKVERDTLMRRLALEHPAWGFEEHKGYGTGEHLEALRVHGPCVLHRRSFLRGGGTDTLL